MLHRRLITGKSDIHGIGCFSCEEIPEGELVISWLDDIEIISSGEYLSFKKNNPHFEMAVRLHGDKFIKNLSNEKDASDYLNHSTTPNLKYYMGLCISNRHIKKWEELTIDYSLLNHPSEVVVVPGRE